ncbi:MAG: AcvB/VirJ family lysyl-phosphatidylglycerol hydrolase [Desulfobacterales bacterium]|jgi:type IV secretory pathway VirJ component
MKRIGVVFLLFSAVLAAHVDAMGKETLDFGRFGTVHIYRQRPHPARVVLFVSGDGGWNLGVVDMARELSGLDALVVGIDIVHYLSRLGKSGSPCLYPAADFELLSKFVQKRLGYPQYVPPILVGYSSGATLVYLLAVQAPAGTFKAALSLGFGPDLNLAGPPCRTDGLSWKKGPTPSTYLLEPAKRLGAPWVVLQGEIDQVCSPAEARAFAGRVAGARIVMLPKVGHGFSVPRNWMPQFKAAFAGLAATEAASAPAPSVLYDLPLVEVKAQAKKTPLLAVLVTGDGGWAGIDREIAGALAAEGIPVVGIDSLKYFWSPRTPEGAAKDLERVLVHYLEAWQKTQAVLIGYSLGADVLPAMTARLGPATRARVRLIALLAPGTQTAFEFHLGDWVGKPAEGKQYLILPEIETLADLPVLCVCGEKETDSLCREKLPPAVSRILMPGAHHFEGDYEAVVKQILDHLRFPARPSS